MKKRLALWLMLCLLLTPFARSAEGIDLDRLSPAQLETLRLQVDARIRQAQLPDAEGYLALDTLEAYARDPAQHLEQKIRLEAMVLDIDQEEAGYTLTLIQSGAKQRVLQAAYALKPDERLILPGDVVTVFGVFKGLAPFSGTGQLTDGALLIKADLITPALQDMLQDASTRAGAREHPIPLNTLAVYEGDYYTQYASFEIELQSSHRGSDALKRAKSMSSYNINPTKTQEYFLIYLRVKALSAPGGRAPISKEDFYFVSASGTEYRQHFLINPPSDLRTLYDQGEQTAVIGCLIDKGDTPFLVFQPNSAHPLWFSPNP